MGLRILYRPESEMGLLPKQVNYQPKRWWKQAAIVSTGYLLRG